MEFVHLLKLIPDATIVNLPTNTRVVYNCVNSTDGNISSEILFKLGDKT